MGGGRHREPRAVCNLSMPASPPRNARWLRPYILRALHQATLRDQVRSAGVLVGDEVCALPKLQAAIQDGRDSDLASMAALGATRLQRPGGPLPVRLPIQWIASADGRPPGESLSPSHHRLPRRRLSIHGACSGSRGPALPNVSADARALPELQAPSARQQDGGARLRERTEGCSEEYVNTPLTNMIA